MGLLHAIFRLSGSTCGNQSYSPWAISKCVFSLPEGYTFVEETVNSLIILKNGYAIGGLILTGLDVSYMEDTGNSEMHK